MYSVENQITDDGQDGQKLSLDDPGTESIYEHDALNASLPQSQVQSQSNLILAKDEENELNGTTTRCINTYSFRLYIHTNYL